MQSDMRNVVTTVERLRLNHAHWRVFAAAWMADASLAALVESPIYLRNELTKNLLIDDAERAHLVMVAFLGIAAGGLVYSAINSALGRRDLMMIGLLPGSLLIASQATARSYNEFMYIRGCAGFFIGIAISGAGVYLSEFLPISHRGRLMFAFRLAYSATAFVMVTLSGHLAMQSFLFVTGFPAALAFLLIVFLPESPRFLVSAGRDQEVRGVIAWLSGDEDAAPLNNPQEDMQVEYNALENQEGSASSSSAASSSPPVASRGFWTNVLRVSLPWIFLATSSGGLRYILPVYISPKDDPVIMISACTAADMVGNLLATSLADTVDRCTMFVSGLLVAACSTVAVLLSASTPCRIVFAALQQGSQALPWLTILTLSCEMFPTEQRAAAAAGTRAVELIFLATSPVLAGHAAESGETEAAIGAYALIYALGSLSAWLLLRDVPTMVGRPMVESPKQD